MAVMTFWSGRQLFSTVALRRTREQGPFTEAELLQTMPEQLQVLA